jgi:hypothetical protein
VPDPGCALDAAEAIAVFVVAVVVILFVVLIGLPLLIALGELVLVLLLAVLGVVGRVVFRRPWIVDAVGPGGEHHVWNVVGWRASGAVRRFVAERVATTGAVPGDDEVAAAAMAA